MSPEATVSDEVAKAAKDTTKNNKNTKSIRNKKDKIRLNGQYFLATKSDLNKLIASTSIS